jgi:hypothetical protein
MRTESMNRNLPPVLLVLAVSALVVVKDELGAGIAVAGATSAVFGLYLRYR